MKFQHFTDTDIYRYVFSLCLYSFQGSLMNNKFKITASFKIKIFCNIINVFTVTFEQLNDASLTNENMNFLKKEKKLTDPNGHAHK